MAMIERAARALCENEGEDPDELVQMTDDSMIPRWQSEVWRVRAVLAAMREPTDDMVQAGLDAAGGDGSCLAAYEAMIDAALSE